MNKNIIKVLYIACWIEITIQLVNCVYFQNQDITIVGYELILDIRNNFLKNVSYVQGV